MDDDFALELDDILMSIDSAEVISLYFPMLWKAVVIDTRFNDTQGPLVNLSGMVDSPEERLRSIRRMRPSFPRVHNLTLIPWVRSIEGLVNHGVWQRIIDRFEKTGHHAAVDACETILDELSDLESSEIASAIIGRNYETIWPKED